MNVIHSGANRSSIAWPSKTSKAWAAGLPRAQPAGVPATTPPLLCCRRPPPSAAAAEGPPSQGPNIVLPRSPTARSPFQARRDKAARAATASARTGALTSALLAAAPVAHAGVAAQCAAPAAASPPASAASGGSDRDVCSWLAGWAALAARSDVIPAAVVQQLDRLAYSSGSPASASAQALHCSLSAQGATAVQALTRSSSVSTCPGVTTHKRKAPDTTAAATEQTSWAAKHARIADGFAAAPG